MPSLVSLTARYRHRHQALQRFVAALDPATTGIPVSAQELPTRFRSLLSGRRCLVVLDNAQNPDQIADLIPGTGTSAVLVTSRASLAAVQNIMPHHLGLMSPAESLELLSKVSLRTWPDDQVPDAARMLINQCGRLPLALRIVGAILKNKPYWTLEKVAADTCRRADEADEAGRRPTGHKELFRSQLSAPWE